MFSLAHQSIGILSPSPIIQYAGDVRDHAVHKAAVVGSNQVQYSITQWQPLVEGTRKKY
jgi:hypothetical protein